MNARQQVSRGKTRLRSHEPGTILSWDIKIMEELKIFAANGNNAFQWNEHHFLRYFVKYHRDYCSTAVKHYFAAFLIRGGDI